MTIAGARRPGMALVDPTSRRYDAVLVVSYGGPEGPDDVLPFLENATRGRGVPRERLLEVAEHYLHFGGVSPINAQNRDLVNTLGTELRDHGHDLPVYLGNRNWHPLLEDTIRRMADDGVERAIAVVTSAFSCYSGCRQYREDVVTACERVGPDAPTFDKVRVFFNHPGFVAAAAQALRETLDGLAAPQRSGARLVFTAHSIPLAMALGSAYEAQLRESARLVAAEAGFPEWLLAWQSRSGPPSVPWLEPDIGDLLESLASQGVTEVVVQPLGFLSDHMEVLFDLDVEAATRARELGIGLHRAGTVGTRPTFVAALRELIEERLDRRLPRRAIGTLGPSHDICPAYCCPSGRPARAAS